VQAIQGGAPILSVMASFQEDEPGLEHQAPMPQVPPPEDLVPGHELRLRWADDMPQIGERFRSRFLRTLPVEFRSVHPWNPLKPEVREPRQHIWFRASGTLPDDPLLHTCVLAYATDFKLLSTALLPHGRTWFSRDMIVASIDHALWFHRPVKVDDWLLYAMESPSAQGARGLSRALIFERGGRLVASVAQESLMRHVTPASP
jgi:acyl-CoA thioesterase II